MSSINTGNFIPIGTRVLVTLDKAATKSAGGIILQGATVKAPTRGIVKFMPDNPKDSEGLRKFPFKVGDTVQFSEESAKAGTKTVVDGQEYTILNSTTFFGFYPQVEEQYATNEDGIIEGSIKIDNDTTLENNTVKLKGFEFLIIDENTIEGPDIGAEFTMKDPEDFGINVYTRKKRQNSHNNLFRYSRAKERTHQE